MKSYYLVFLVVIFFFATFSSSKGFNASNLHKDDLESILEILDLIESRLGNLVHGKQQKFSENLGTLKHSLEVASNAKDEALASYHQTKGYVEANFEEDIRKAHERYEDALKIVEEKEMEFNNSKKHFSETQKMVDLEKSKLKTEHEEFLNHIEAEKELIEKIRQLLENLKDRTIKDHQEACSEEWQCLPGFICDQGTCKQSLGGACKTNNDCVTDHICSSNTCKSTLRGKCTVSQECHGNLVCENDICLGGPLNSCENKNDCSDDLICDHGKCKLKHMDNCSQGDSCADGLMCDDGKCKGLNEFSCSSSIECVSGLSCMNSKCTSDIGQPICQSGTCPSLPNSVVHDFDIDDLLSSGWKIVYRHDYGHGTTESELRSLRSSGGYFCVGGKEKNSNKFISAAFGKAEDVFRETSSNSVAVKGNGTNVYWYFVESRSFGYADSETISLNSADTNSRSSNNRLSWHVRSSGSVGGWRVGGITNLKQHYTYK